MARTLIAVSDNVLQRRFTHVLACASHEVRTCDDVESVIRELTGPVPIDVFLLHAELDGGGASAVCAKLTKSPGLTPVPLVMIVPSLPLPGASRAAASCDIDDFVLESASGPEIVARVEFNARSKRVAAEFRRHNSELEIKVVENTRKVAALVDELRRERDTLRETVNLIEDGVLLLDDEGTVVIENTAGQRLRGGAESEPGRSLADMGLVALARQARVAGSRVELGMTRTQRQFMVAAHPTGDRVLLQVRDVTDARDQELRRLQSEKLASIGLLAAGVAHEINNPASFVLHNLDAVMAVLQTVDAKVATQSQVARRSGAQELLFEAMSILQESKEGMARIARIVRDLHSFSRIDDDTQVATDANAAMESALSMLRNELRYRATVVRDLRAKRSVPGGAARLGQVFLNLVLNAAHAMCEGGPERNRLWVRSYDTADGLVVEVQDNGPGIPDEVMGRIFESFFTTKPRGVGTGLGLPICRDIVQSLGGAITAESQVGRGALFRVRLPYLSTSPHPNLPRLDSASGRRRRVLAIDDETLLLKAYRRMLIDHHDLVPRPGAQEALELLATDRNFDVILCDLQMPGMSGAELFAVVRDLYPELSDRFLFITGGVFAPEARRFLEDSPTTCISKPFQLEELLERIERIGQKATGPHQGPAGRRPTEFADSVEIGH